MAKVYADNGLREDGKKRYPIDTPEATRASALLFKKAANRAKYTKDQVSTIDDNLQAAMKKHGIDKAAPVTTPAAAAPEAVTIAMIDERIAAAVGTLKADLVEAVKKAAPEPVDVAPLALAVKAIGERLDEQKTALATVSAESKAAAAAAQSAGTTLAAVVGKAAEPTAEGGLPTTAADGTTVQHPATGEPTKKAAPPTPAGLTGLAAAVHAQRYEIAAP